MLPPVIYSLYYLGVSAIYLFAAAVLTSIFAEIFFSKIAKPNSVLNIKESALAGILLTMMLPVSASWAVIAAGVLFSVIIVSRMLNRYRKVVLSPAVTGWIFVQLIFPAQTGGQINAFFEKLLSRAAYSGNIFSNFLLSGSPQSLSFIDLSLICLALGAVFLLLCGRSELEASLPYMAVFLAGFAAVSLIEKKIVYPEPLFAVAIFSIFFLAGDISILPASRAGKIIFGSGCGILSFFLYAISGMPQSLYISIFLLNLFVPLINIFTTPVPLGANKA